MLPQGDDIPPAPGYRTLDENTNLDDLLAASYTYADIEARSGDLLAARARVRFVAGDDRIVGNNGVLFPFLLVAARTEADLSVRAGRPGTGGRRVGGPTGSISCSSWRRRATRETRHTRRTSAPSSRAGIEPTLR